MMKSVKKAVIFTVLTVLWTGVIFSFSLQPAEASASLSGGLLQCLLNWIDWLTGIQILVSFAHFLIRKLAHFLEFFLLGTLSFEASKHLFSKWYPSFCYGAMIAVCDELLQYVTGGGRAMRLTDMLLDMFGVGVGILLVSFCQKFLANRKNKNADNNKKSA